MLDKKISIEFFNLLLEEDKDNKLDNNNNGLEEFTKLDLTSDIHLNNKLKINDIKIWSDEEIDEYLYDVINVEKEIKFFECGK